MPLEQLGLASYDVQSYGDDGGVGCPQMDVEPGLGLSFAPTLAWVFSTCWWVDGCTPNGDTEVIYRMGPSSYDLFGSASMFYNHADGLNVMSTFFDPALIDTYANRVLFLQQTIAHMGSNTGIASNPETEDPSLTLLTNDAKRLIVQCTEPLRSVDVHNTVGARVWSDRAKQSMRVEVALSDASAGMHVITATTVSGKRLSAKWVVR